MSEAYHNFYKKIYPNWDQLFETLKTPDKHVLRGNSFYIEAFPEQFKLLLQNQKSAGVGIGIAPLENCFEVGSQFNLNDFPDLIYPFYKMDAASIIPPKALNIQPHETVLDMCSAPGGKSLVLFEGLNKSGVLVCNEFSPKRKHRLMSVIKRYIPTEIRHLVKIHGQDGNLYGLKNPESFDKILLDAPCSGDRDLVQSPDELKNWKEKRTKSFGIRQYSLLASAFSAVKRGGRIVYSTCSMSPHENDEVVRKLLKRKGDEVNIIPVPFKNWGIITEFGSQILPTQLGYGPIYYSVIEKNK